LFDAYFEYLAFQRWISCYKAESPWWDDRITQFIAMLEKQRSQWTDSHSGKKDRLLPFSGDVSSPSVENGVRRGAIW